MQRGGLEREPNKEANDPGGAAGLSYVDGRRLRDETRLRKSYIVTDSLVVPIGIVQLNKVNVLGQVIRVIESTGKDEVGGLLAGGRHVLAGLGFSIIKGNVF